ncbi:MAG: hypothetical protein CMP39_04395 [Rickettsiales bacterium]|nr:hypothetical protein [Rickettsiales bacterium]|tara:strand:- start:3144 stop:3497 length:354 start_codon:yes stop_codon:yes gene_type:complete
MIEGSVLEMVNSLGINVVTLLACFWFIRFQTLNNNQRESEWLKKDTESDLRLAESHRQLADLQQATTKELANIQSHSNAQLLGVLEKVNITLTSMTVAISELKQTIDVAENISTKNR